MGKILAISNHKGGVGKTMTTKNLGSALALCGKKVLMVDLDAQKNLTFLYGIDGDEIVANGGYSIAHCLAKDLIMIDKENQLEIVL